MMDFAQALRMAADAAEDYQNKARAQYQDSRESGIDTQTVVDALATLGGTAFAGVMDLVDRSKRKRASCTCRGKQCGSGRCCTNQSCTCKDSNTCGTSCCSDSTQDSCCQGDNSADLPVHNISNSADIESEVEKVAGRLGLVQEDELAALRKRVIELEQRLNATPSDS